MPRAQDEYYPIICRQILRRISTNMEYFSNIDCYSQYAPRFAGHHLGPYHSNPDQAWFTNCYCTDHTVASAFFILLSVKVVWSNFVCTNNFKTTQVLGTKLFAPFIMANDKVLFELKSFYYLIFWSEPWDRPLSWYWTTFQAFMSPIDVCYCGVWVPASKRECQH